MLVLGAAAASLAGGCKEEEGVAVDRKAHSNELVQVVCDSYVACDCDDDATLLENDLECPVALQPGVEAAMANASDLGMRFYPDCLGQYDQYLDVVACNTEFEVEGMYDAGDPKLRKLSDSISRCKLLAGSMSRGQTCSAINVPGGGFIGDNCGHDLFCGDGLCRPFPTKQGDWCGGAFDCPGDLTCLDPDADGVLTCENRATAGQLCNPHDGLGCVEDLYCDGDSLTCAVLPDAGESCLDDPWTSQTCSKDAVCVGDVCEALLNVGADCSGGVCNPATSYCNTTSYTCIALPGQGDECVDSGGLCREGLSCLGEASDLECKEAQPLVCFLPEAVGVCIYQDDGVCDEPEGTGLCSEGTDPVDCDGWSASDSDTGPSSGSASTTGETGDSDSFTTGDDSDSFTTGDDVCPYRNDGYCDEPELCPPGTDPEDCEGAGSSGGDSGSGDPVCNNGVVESGEQCDAADLQGFDCIALGYTGGTLYCDAELCTFDTSFCS